MIAQNLISNTFAPLKTSDTGEEALTMMHVYHLKHLPIVNNTQLLGTISEDNIMQHTLEEAIGSYSLSLSHAYVKDTDHVFEIMAKLADNSLTIIPVIDKDENYMGLISMEDLIHFYANSFSFKEPGSIVVLEIEKNQYSLSEISNIVESESAVILSSFLTQEENTNLVCVTIKVNLQEISAILKSLERYDYRIKASFTESEYFDDLKDRYDSLMTYLNV